MPDLNDFHAFKSTSGCSSGGGSGFGGGGSGCLSWVLVCLAILWVIGKLA